MNLSTIQLFEIHEMFKIFVICQYFDEIFHECFCAFETSFFECFDKNCQFFVIYFVIAFDRIHFFEHKRVVEKIYSIFDCVKKIEIHNFNIEF